MHSPGQAPLTALAVAAIAVGEHVAVDGDVNALDLVELITNRS